MAESSSSESESEYDDSGSDVSVQSMPEMQDLETCVMKRYTTYHPKDMIPVEEKMVALSLREFNDHFYDEEEQYEDENDELQREINEKMEIINAASSYTSKRKKKSTKHKKEKERVKHLKEMQERLKKEFLHKKDQLERYYSKMCLYSIDEHVDPPGELVSIKNLLKKNPSTLHAIIIHLNHFSYIDSDLEEESDSELPDMESDDEFLFEGGDEEEEEEE